jgi:hypothetical protein
MPEVQLVTVPHAGRLLGISQRAVWRLIETGVLTAYRVSYQPGDIPGKHCSLVSLTEVEARRRWREERDRKSAEVLAAELANPPPPRKLPPSPWTQAPEKLIRPPAPPKAKR